MKIAKTATLELPAYKWKMIIFALQETPFMPEACRSLADEIDGLTAAQFINAQKVSA